MKKFLALLLSFILLLSLVSGCTRTETDMDDDDDTTTADTQEQTEPEANAPTEKEVERDEEQEEASAPAGYIRGTNSAGGWKSEYLGLQFTPTSSMTMATEADMDALMDLSGDVMKDNGYGESVVDYTMLRLVFEMMASDSTGSNVAVTVEKMVLSNMSTAAYMDSLIAQLKNMSYTVGRTYDISLCGKNYLAVDTVNTVNNVTMTQTYLLIKIEDRMCSIIITDVTGDSAEIFLNCFSAY